MTAVTPIKSPWITAFGVVAIVHLVLDGTNASPWESISKSLLAPLLAAWVIGLKGPRLLVAALVLCFVGDLFLELSDSVFLVGMAAFAGAHICFIRFFLARGAATQLRRELLIVVIYVAIYVAAAIAMVAYSSTGLDAGLRSVIPVYAALFVGTAVTSLATDLRAGVGVGVGVGGALFLISDGIIALGKVHRINNGAAVTGLAVMAFYILALLFLTSGITTKQTRTIEAGTDFDPTIRTHCWPVLPESSAAKA